MTREEAIEVIRDIYNYTKWDTYTTNEARTMAINALEQEPSGEWLRRQDVIKVLTKNRVHFYDMVKITSELKELSSVKQEPKILNTLDFAIDASNGDTNYFVGFRNGLRYAKSLIDGEEEPQFESCAEPKTGHWIEDDMTYCGVELTNYKCDKCGEIGGAWRKNLKPNQLPKYCQWCGARMVEPQETETWNGYHGQITAPKGTFERIFNDADDEDDI